MNNDYSEENSMVTGLQYEEGYNRDEPEFDSADYYEEKYGMRGALKHIGAGFSEAYLKDNDRSLDEKIRDLLFEIAATDRVPHYATVSILKETLDHLDKDKVRVASLADDFDAAAKRIESSLMGRKQA